MKKLKSLKKSKKRRENFFTVFLIRQMVYSDKNFVSVIFYQYVIFRSFYFCFEEYLL